MVARMCMQSPWICCLAGMSQTCECMRRHVMVQVAGACTHQHGQCLEAELEGRRNLRGPGVHRVTEGAWLRMPFQNGGECLFKPCHASCVVQIVGVVVQSLSEVWHNLLLLWCKRPSQFGLWCTMCWGCGATAPAAAAALHPKQACSSPCGAPVPVVGCSLNDAKGVGFWCGFLQALVWLG